jgi:hypothetical protein
MKKMMSKAGNKMAKAGNKMAKTVKNWPWKMIAPALAIVLGIVCVMGAVWVYQKTKKRSDDAKKKKVAETPVISVPDMPEAQARSQRGMVEYSPADTTRSPRRPRA